MSPFPTLHLAVALSDAGWHPAAWREPGARSNELLTPAYWVDQVRTAESGDIDFVTFDDALGLQSSRRGVDDGRIDQVRGRLDAVLIAARVAPVTSRIGLVPVATTTHTEPFHISKAIATLDYVSAGRAGMQARISPTPLEAELFGRRTIGDPRADNGHGEHVVDLFDEAADFVEVVRRLWDSWEDDAEIRDVTTGRFVNRDKLHYIDFEGRFFSVRGPSITPRPPQGQPVVAVLAHVPPAFELAARSADVVFTTPYSAEDARTLIGDIRAFEATADRSGPPLRIFGDILVFLDDTEKAALGRKERLDELDGRPLRSDALVFAGTPDRFAELVAEWAAAGLDGIRLRPGAVPHDLDVIADQMTAALARTGLATGATTTTTGDGEPPERTADDGPVDSGATMAPTLRERLGLERPENRYAA